MRRKSARRVGNCNQASVFLYSISPSPAPRYSSKKNLSILQPLLYFARDDDSPSITICPVRPRWKGEESYWVRYYFDKLYALMTENCISLICSFYLIYGRADSPGRRWLSEARPPKLAQWFILLKCSPWTKRGCWHRERVGKTERMPLTFDNNVDDFTISGLDYRCAGHNCSRGDEGKTEEDLREFHYDLIENRLMICRTGCEVKWCCER